MGYLLTYFYSGPIPGSSDVISLDQKLQLYAEKNRGGSNTGASGPTLKNPTSENAQAPHFISRHTQGALRSGQAHVPRVPGPQTRVTGEAGSVCARKTRVALGPEDLAQQCSMSLPGRQLVRTVRLATTGMWTSRAGEGRWWAGRSGCTGGLAGLPTAGEVGTALGPPSRGLYIPAPQRQVGDLISV